MPKIYFSAPYTSKAEKRKDAEGYGQIKDREYAKFLQRITNVMIECGYSVILPHKYVYEWGNTHFDAKAVVSRAFQSLSTCDILVALPEKSMGVNVLIGWASMMRKKVIILLWEDQDISVVYAGLGFLSETKILKFKNEQELEEKLRNELKKK